MNKRNLLILGGVLLLLLIPFSMWWFSEERAVKRRSEHLMNVLTISAETSGIFRHAKAFSMSGVLASTLEMESATFTEANGSFPKDQIESAFSWICTNANESEFEITEFRDVKIKGNSATVHAEVRGFIEIKKSRPADGVFDVTLYWEKIDGSWVLAKIIWN